MAFLKKKKQSVRTSYGDKRPELTIFTKYGNISVAGLLNKEEGIC